MSGRAMPPLRRHQLADLNTAGWREILDRDWDAASRACLQHWADYTLPLVVTRQAPPSPERHEHIWLGLATPTCWGRRPLALQAAPAHVASLREFPALAQVLQELPRGAQAPLRQLDAALHAQGCRAHAYGSAGWQQLTRLAYLHDRSDLDLWLAIDNAEQADTVTGLLHQCASTMRLDGELMFPDGSAVAWREWAAWRAGRCRQVLVKRLHGATLEDATPTLSAAWPRVA